MFYGFKKGNNIAETIWSIHNVFERNSLMKEICKDHMKELEKMLSAY